MIKPSFHPNTLFSHPLVCLFFCLTWSRPGLSFAQLCEKAVATQAAWISYCFQPLSLSPTDQIFFFFLQPSGYSLLLMPTKYTINSLSPVHVKSERTKVSVCSLITPVCEQCKSTVFAHQMLLLEQWYWVHAGWLQQQYRYVMLRSRNEQHPDHAVFLVVSRKNTVMALESWWDGRAPHWMAELQEDPPSGSNCLKCWEVNEQGEIGERTQRSWNRFCLQQLLYPQCKLPRQVRRN